MDTTGRYYSHLKRQESAFESGPKYSQAELSCIQKTLSKLGETVSTSAPGLLLGKIQSGKTKSFIGIIALAFDNGYDVVVVLTKNSEALTKQTTSRLSQEFQDFRRSIHVKDVLQTKGALHESLAGSKLILVSKKEHTNIEYVIQALTSHDSCFRDKRTLIIDDEADNASVSFTGGKKSQEELRKVAKKIDTLRRLIGTRPAFLQVTATPYSLLLQNKSSALRNDPSTKPLRPAFVQLVPVHKDYFGGENYFGMIAEDKNKPESLMHASVSFEEMKRLRLPASVPLKGLDPVGEDAPFPALTKALVTFIVGGAVRRIQQLEEGRDTEEVSNYAMLMHTDANKTSHEWQSQVVGRILAAMREQATTHGSKQFDLLIESAYNDLSISVALEGLTMPEKRKVVDVAKGFLTSGLIQQIVVNSDRDVASLLNATSGELNLESDLTVFIGGQYMDRGVTVPNLIAFFYGRSPKTFQQDTVLQHCRMFGFRQRPEVAVTRFYTTDVILAVLKEMHANDCTLRDRIEKFGVDDQMMRVLQKGSATNIRFCSFDKIRASRVRILDKETKIWPRGFQLRESAELKKITLKIDDILEQHRIAGDFKSPVEVDVATAVELVRNVSRSFQEFAPLYSDSWVQKDIEHLLHVLTDTMAGRFESDTGKVQVVLRYNRDRPNQFSKGKLVLDSPDQPTDDTKPCRLYAKRTPVLLLTRQNGKHEDAWGGTPFWWPVLFPPNDENCYIYSCD